LGRAFDNIPRPVSRPDSGGIPAGFPTVGKQLPASLPRPYREGLPAWHRHHFPPAIPAPFRQPFGGTFSPPFRRRSTAPSAARFRYPSGTLSRGSKGESESGFQGCHPERAPEACRKPAGRLSAPTVKTPPNATPLDKKSRSIFGSDSRSAKNDFPASAITGIPPDHRHPCGGGECPISATVTVVLPRTRSNAG